MGRRGGGGGGREWQKQEPRQEPSLGPPLALTTRLHALSETTDAVCYLGVFVLCIPDVGARPHTVVGMVTRGFVDPFPAQVLTEVYVQLTHTTALRLTGGAKLKDRN